MSVKRIPSWLQGNTSGLRKWGLAALSLCTVAIIGWGGAFYFGIDAVKESDPYGTSLQRVGRNPEPVKISVAWAHGKDAALKTPQPQKTAAAEKESKPGEAEKARPAKDPALELDAIMTAIAKGDAEAPRQLRGLAAKGNIKALLLLGNLHLTGVGVQKNASIAFNMFYRAAQTGDATAQYRIALLYLEGVGTAFDQKKAKQWFSRAAAQGFMEARKNLRRLGVTPPPVEKPPAKKDKEPVEKT